MAEISTEKKLTPQQRKCIEALMTTGSVSEAALASGVSRTVVYKWYRQSDFVEALAEAEAEAVKGLSRALAGLGSLASAALADALDSQQKITVRLRASEIVLANLLRLREMAEFEQRLRELEGLVNGQGQNQTPALAGSSLAAPTGNGATVDTITG